MVLATAAIKLAAALAHGDLSEPNSQGIVRQLLAHDVTIFLCFLFGGPVAARLRLYAR